MSGSDDEDNEGPLSKPFFAPNSRYPEATARMKAYYEKTQAEAAAKIDGNRIDFQRRQILEDALEQYELLVETLRRALDEGWPPEVPGDFPILVNWARVSKTRVPCLEGNYFWIGSDGTVRGQTAPLLVHDPVRGLALTTDGWVRLEQPLVPSKTEEDD